MEPRGNEQEPKHNIYINENNPLLDRIRNLTDRIKFKKTAPLSWTQFKETILENREEGLLEDSAPRSFTISNSLLETFQEMLPVTMPGKIDSKIFPKAAFMAKTGREVSRSIVMDASRRHLLVHVFNGGTPTTIEGRPGILHNKVLGEIGTIHTHPVSDNLPSSIDIIPFLHDKQTLGFVVTPYRTIGVFRTNRTPYFSDISDANDYLDHLGKVTGNLPGADNSTIWKPGYNDLRRLHLLGYEAQRGSNLFVRKR
jgi:hypothetical protein